MKRLISILLSKSGSIGHWWDVSEATGEDPSTERTYMFTYPQVLDYLRQKLNKYKGE